MKTVNGLVQPISAGSENFEFFYSEIARKELCDYDYRHIDGELFSCIKPTLDECRVARNRWLERRAVS